MGHGVQALRCAGMTRSEVRLGDVPASMSVIGRDDIRRSPAVLADDVLRQLPSFSLFRRTSSLSSHPTSQGVSLRGIGPSGVSRTLVLLDGVPYNDPFGGWVYWTGIPLDSADRIDDNSHEYDENGHSNRYGFGRVNAAAAVRLAVSKLPLSVSVAGN